MPAEEAIKVELISVLMKARRVRDLYLDYCARPDSTPISVDDLHHVIESYSGIKITTYQLRTVPADGIVQGRYDRYKHSANIFYTPPLGPEPDASYEQRFIAVKEMAHVIIDTQDSFVTDAIKLAQQICHSNSNSIMDCPEYSQSEQLAEVVALELLYPWVLRVDSKEGLSSLAEISTKFKLPQFLIEWLYLPGIHDTLARYHQEISGLLSTEREHPHPEEDT